ncbi:myocyte-specific enhancer factor 2D isoform X7 [Periophthalmus magnuspinnatus]|uniref:myocyte-specific enhancer factor 2D isoform X7 n=1 Tax=Periophthalmus magnuspinnatus TaxID=409849 RepID=UPI00145A8557|nr:myocyte-specific enhancer factor 2D isoform X7 [Periophthalmus magnuspinnatus]
MGRKKIQIQRITDERNRQVTFTKRKFGLMKKAYELSVLCDCEIALIIFNHSNKLFQYASTDMDKVLLKYTEYNEPHESRTNADIIEALNKKEHRDSESPDPEEPFSLTPRTEEKYKKIDEEFDKMMQNYRLSSTVPQPTFSMPVTVPVSNQNPAASALQFSNNPAGALVTTTSFVSSALSDPRLLSPQQSALQRNAVSPGLPQRPASAGALLGGDLGNSNGACPSPVSNGYISARASPGLLSVSNGNSMGKVVPAKSPPPPSPQMVNSRKPDLRVITSQGGKSLIQLNAQRLGGSQVAQSLTTPVVSVATPSLLAPFSGIQAYNTEYQLMSADLTALQTFTPPGLVPGNMAAWQQQQQQQQTSMGQTQQQQISLGSLSNLVPVSHLSPGTALTVNTNPNVSIKTEPVSPNRDRSTPSSISQGALNHIQVPGASAHQGLVSIAYPGALRLDAGGQGRSPVDSLSSNGSSYEGSERDGGPLEFGHQAGALVQQQQQQMVLLRPSSAEPQDQDGTSVKRMRLDAWVT